MPFGVLRIEAVVARRHVFDVDQELGGRRVGIFAAVHGDRAAEVEEPVVALVHDRRARVLEVERRVERARLDVGVADDVMKDEIVVETGVDMIVEVEGGHRSPVGIEIEHDGAEARIEDDSAVHLVLEAGDGEGSRAGLVVVDDVEDEIVQSSRVFDAGEVARSSAVGEYGVQVARLRREAGRGAYFEDAVELERSLHVKQAVVAGARAEELDVERGVLVLAVRTVDDEQSLGAPGLDMTGVVDRSGQSPVTREDAVRPHGRATCRGQYAGTQEERRSRGRGRTLTRRTHRQ